MNFGISVVYSSFPRKRESRDPTTEAVAPCSCQGQALDPRFRGCREIRSANPKPPIPSFPRKREPRNFSHLPWAPAFAGATIGECCQFDYTRFRGGDDNPLQTRAPYSV
jgi:hypothetical protein